MGEQARLHGALTELAEVASEYAPEVLERALAAAREELGMDVAFVSEFTEERMVFRRLFGDAESFGWRERERAYRWTTPSAACLWRGTCRT